MNSFEARRLVVAILLKTKAWYLQNQINERSKLSNITVSPQAFVKTVINNNIYGFFLYDISSTKIAIPPSPTYDIIFSKLSRW